MARNSSNSLDTPLAIAFPLLIFTGAFSYKIFEISSIKLMQLSISFPSFCKVLFVVFD